MTPRQWLLITAAVVAVGTGLAVAALLPSRMCMGNVFDHQVCSGTPDWVRVVVVGIGTLIGLVLAAVALGSPWGSGRPTGGGDRQLPPAP